MANGDSAPPPEPSRRWLIPALVAALVAALIGITTAKQPPAERRHPAIEPMTPPTFRDAKVPFPDATASDVVSYADHVALVTAVSETERPQSASPSATAAGELAIYRRVRFRVDATLWSRDGARTTPADFTAVCPGWLVRDHKRVPFVIHGAPWIIVGAQYVMPIAHTGTAFEAIQPFAAFRFDRGAVALEDQDSPLARQLARATSDVVRAVFAQAVPDPLALRYRDLLPGARFAAVVRARSSNQVLGSSGGTRRQAQ